jgi:hypothetical protein
MSEEAVKILGLKVKSHMDPYHVPWATNQNTIWNAIPGCLMWLIWRERNQRAFEDIERHTVDLKLSFIRTLMEWMAVLSSQAIPSIITFIDECI